MEFVDWPFPETYGVVVGIRYVQTGTRVEARQTGDWNWIDAYLSETAPRRIVFLVALSADRDHVKVFPEDIFLSSGESLQQNLGGKGTQVNDAKIRLVKIRGLKFARNAYAYTPVKDVHKRLLREVFISDEHSGDIFSVTSFRDRRRVIAYFVDMRRCGGGYKSFPVDRGESSRRKVLSEAETWAIAQARLALGHMESDDVA